MRHSGMDKLLTGFEIGDEQHSDRLMRRIGADGSCANPQSVDRHDTGASFAYPQTVGLCSGGFFLLV